MTEFVLSIAIVAVSALWGGMLFFAAVFAPLVFIKLDAETAGRFIRQVFPVYYLSMGIVSAVAAIAVSVSPSMDSFSLSRTRIETTSAGDCSPMTVTHRVASLSLPMALT